MCTYTCIAKYCINLSYSHTEYGLSLTSSRRLWPNIIFIVTATVRAREERENKVNRVEHQCDEKRMEEGYAGSERGRKEGRDDSHGTMERSEGIARGELVTFLGRREANMSEWRTTCINA